MNGLIKILGNIKNLVDNKNRDNNDLNQDNDVNKGLNKIKTRLKNKLIAKVIFIFVVPFFFIILFTAIYNFINPLASLMATNNGNFSSLGISGSSSSSNFWNNVGNTVSCFFNGTGCSISTTEQQIYSDIISRKKSIDKSNGSNIDPYLVMSTIFSYTFYNSENDSTSDVVTSEKKKYFDEAQRMLDVVLPASGGSDLAITKSEDSYKEWLVSSGELEKHLVNIGVSLPEDETEKKESLESVASDIVSQKNLYAYVYGDSEYLTSGDDINGYGFSGGALTGDTQVLSLSQAMPLWNKISVGNPLFACNISTDMKWGGPYQCTSFAWWRFKEYYGDSYRNGDGNGFCWAWQVCERNPGKFELSTSPAPGAIFSLYGSGHNHVGFVEKVEGSTFWISEGNYNVGGIRLNYPIYSISQLTGGYGNVIFAVPCPNGVCTGGCDKYTSEYCRE